MRAGRLRRGLWIVVAIALAIIAPPAGFVGWRYAHSNFGTLEPGRIYRSKQMNAHDLTATVQTYGLKTVLNLRGVNESDAWYRDELQATIASKATQVDFKMASDQWLSRLQLRSLIRIFDTCEYPILLHCEFGSERTGLASAIAVLLQPGRSLEEARAQFSLHYLYYVDKTNYVLPDHINQYEAWLRARAEPHSPERFRGWAWEGFVPGQPSREYWPYNPDPLVVVTRPSKPVMIGSVPETGRR